MPLYRDKQTGKVVNFDHEPTEDELNSRFLGTAAPAGQQLAAQSGVTPQPPAAPQGPEHSLGRIAATDIAAPMAGFSLGGAVGGKPGAVLGATLGTGLGDLYNTVADYGQSPIGPMDFDTSKLGPNAPPSMYDEFKRLLGAGAGAAAGAYVLPPLTKALPGPVSLKNAGLGFLAGGAAGNQLGHPGLGAAIGAAAGGYNALTGLLKGAGNLSEALTTPRFGGAEGGLSAAEQALLSKQGYSPETMARVAQTASAKPTPPSPSVQAGPPSAPEEGYVSKAFSGLKGMFASEPPIETPAAPPKPNLFRGNSIDDAFERVGATPGKLVSAQPDLSRTPDASWSADVTAAPQRTPSLTQTSPTDPKMDWNEYASRSNPKRTSTGGSNYAVEEQNIRTNPQTGQSFAGDSASGPLSGLKAPLTRPPLAAQGAPDPGLQKWVEAGGSPDAYMKLKVNGADPNFNQGVGDPLQAGSHPYGPNTVGAAQRQSYLPQSVNENKGLSLADADAWDTHKQATGATDAGIDDWFRSNKLGGNPNEGLDIPSLVEKLTSLLRPSS